MFDIDFLAVENDDSSSTHSGDAIIAHFSVPGRSEPAIVVIDAGYSGTGDEVADHIRDYYGTDRVDLIISTHPDSDHLNGIKTVLDRCRVDELWIHQPDLYIDASAMGNHDKLVEVLDLAIVKGVVIREPFAGLSAFGDSLTVLGPTADYYKSLVGDIVNAPTTYSAFESAYGSTIVKLAARALNKVLQYFPIETLRDDDDDSARNQSSVILLLDIDGDRLLFTGDAGIEALNRAADGYEVLHGSFGAAPLHMFQVPHHGSKHNLGPTVLDRVVGAGAGPRVITAIASSSKSSEKHPSPKVTNALGRRGARVLATEGKGIYFHSPGRTRPGWVPIAALPPLEESDS